MELSVATSGSVDWGWYEEIVENVLVAKMHFDCKQFETFIAISQILSKGPNTINKTSLAFRISVLRDKDFMGSGSQKRACREYTKTLITKILFLLLIQTRMTSGMPSIIMNAYKHGL
jgi:hypothetical protein